MGKDLMIGLKGIHFAKVTTHTSTAYATQAGVNLPWAARMALTKKESTQDLYYDDSMYLSLKDLKGYDAELRMAQVSFETLELMGLGTYDAATNTFHENMAVTGGEYSLRLIADTADHHPYYINFRSFTVTGISPDSFATATENPTPNEIIVTGTIGNVQTVGLSYKSNMKLLDDQSNLDACNDFLVDAEVFPAP